MCPTTDKQVIYMYLILPILPTLSGLEINGSQLGVCTLISVNILQNSINCFDSCCLEPFERGVLHFVMQPFKLFSSVQPFDLIHVKNCYICSAVQLHPCGKFLHPFGHSTSSVQNFSLAIQPFNLIHSKILLSHSQYPC